MVKGQEQKRKIILTSNLQNTVIVYIRNHRCFNLNQLMPFNNWIFIRVASNDTVHLSERNYMKLCQNS